MFATVLSQIYAIFILQGNKMDPQLEIFNRNFKVPSASLLVFNALGVIVAAPIYDWVIVPIAKKITSHEQGFTQLQRVGIGLVISAIAMVIAGVLEHFRLNIVRKHHDYDSEFAPVSIFWQVPQYFLVGFAEIFTLVGQIEFFYDQAPDSLRNLCSALSLTTLALGNFLSSFVVIFVTKVTTQNGSFSWIPDNINRGHLDYYYNLLTVLTVINCIVFVWVASNYRYKGDIIDLIIFLVLIHVIIDHQFEKYNLYCIIILWVYNNFKKCLMNWFSSSIMTSSCNHYFEIIDQSFVPKTIQSVRVGL